MVLIFILIYFQWRDNNKDLFFEAYASALEEKILRESNLKEKCHRNRTKEEQKALEDLGSYEDIVIKQVDMRSAVVVMDKNSMSQRLRDNWVIVQYMSLWRRTPAHRVYDREG